eukprot:scpid110416/ scgid33157/ 
MWTDDVKYLGNVIRTHFPDKSGAFSLRRRLQLFVALQMEKQQTTSSLSYRIEHTCIISPCIVTVYISLSCIRSILSYFPIHAVVVGMCVCVCARAHVCLCVCMCVC